MQRDLFETAPPETAGPVGTEAAHARTSDPKTSKDAAATLGAQRLRASQREVLHLFRRYGEMDDRELILVARQNTSLQSDSSLRTRRSELSKANTDRLHAIIEEVVRADVAHTTEEIEAAARERLAAEGYRAPIYDTGKRVKYGSGRKGIVWDSVENLRRARS